MTPEKLISPDFSNHLVNSPWYYAMAFAVFTIVVIQILEGGASEEK